MKGSIEKKVASPSVERSNNKETAAFIKKGRQSIRRTVERSNNKETAKRRPDADQTVKKQQKEDQMKKAGHTRTHQKSRLGFRPEIVDSHLSTLSPFGS